MAKVTISHIAKEAGVSKTAVSFAFNDPSQLAASTVQHIRDIAERLGYTPDPIARSMTTRRTNALGLLLPQDIATALSNPLTRSSSAASARCAAGPGLRSCWCRRCGAR